MTDDGIRVGDRIVVPNFALHERTHDAEVPDHPHIVCADGYAWHPPPVRGQYDRRMCFQGVTAARAADVAAVLQGRPIDRVWALRILLLGENADDPRKMPGAIITLWPSECRGCARDHSDRRVVWRRAALSVHPAAIDTLREVDPPLRLLLDLEVPGERRYRIDHPRARAAGIPVRPTPDETARAQVSWAIDLAARREHPLAAPQRRRRSVRDVAE